MVKYKKFEATRDGVKIAEFSLDFWVKNMEIVLFKEDEKVEYKLQTKFFSYNTALYQNETKILDIKISPRFFASPTLQFEPCIKIVPQLRNELILFINYALNFYTRRMLTF